MPATLFLPLFWGGLGWHLTIARLGPIINAGPLGLCCQHSFGSVLQNYTYASRERVTRTHIHTHHERQKLIETHREKVCKCQNIFTISGFWSGFYEFNGTEALFVCTRFMFPSRPDVVWRANRPNNTNTFRTMAALVFLGTAPGAVCHPRFRIALAWWIWGGCERTSW
jgi:hypothetical protein